MDWRLVEETISEAVKTIYNGCSFESIEQRVQILNKANNKESITSHMTRDDFEIEK